MEEFISQSIILNHKNFKESLMMNTILSSDMRVILKPSIPNREIIFLSHDLLIFQK